MIIELFGLPGSGKTTLAKELSLKTGFPVVKVRNRRELLWYNFLYLLKHPLRFLVALFYIIRHGGSFKLFYLKLMNCFLVHNAKYEKARSLKRGIIDQGHWQNILSVFEKELKEEKLNNYTKYLSKPDVLVTINLSEQERWENFDKRGYSTRDEYGEDYLKGWQEVNLANYNLLLDWASKSGYHIEVVKRQASDYVLPERLASAIENEAY